MKPQWPQIRCRVRDFGPIREGSFDLAPLTVFIGPNGSGKTYAATLAYLWAKALHLVRIENFWNLYNLLAHSTIKSDADPIIVPDMLAPSKQDAYREALRKIAHRSASLLQDQLLRYFGRESPESLMRKGGETLRVGFEWWSAKEPSLSLEGEWCREEGWHWKGEGFERIRLTLARPFGPRRKRFNVDPVDILAALPLGSLSNVFYLPAARAGLLQGWRVLAAMAIRIVRREISLRRIEATPYAGVAGDFLLTIAEGPQMWWEAPVLDEELVAEEISHPDPGQERVTRFLEEEILHGYVDWRSQEDPELLLVQKDIRLPLTAISSGLAELAPLDLLLRRRIIGPGDWLIIEEPEAHLHPENQRRIATLMVRLVRWGVRVLCTTHSDIILHQISNHLLFGEALEKGYQPEGFDPEWDRLGYDEVGVYLFRLEEDGAVIEPVVPEPGFGIPEDEFVRVAEAIGDQTYDLLDLIGTERERPDVSRRHSPESPQRL